MSGKLKFLPCFVFVAAVLLAGCTAPQYNRSRQRETRLTRKVVERELRLLKQRMRVWSQDVDDVHRFGYDAGSAVQMARPYMRRLETGRRTERLLERKLREHRDPIPFNRHEMRLAYRAGCRRHRPAD